MTGSRAGASSVTGSRAGASSVRAGGGSVGRTNLDQKTAFARGLWAANVALARSESTVSAAVASSAARSFLRMLSSRGASAPDSATVTSSTGAFLAPLA